MNDPDLTSLNKLFVRSLLALGKIGDEQCHEACQIAAAGYVALRDTNPREAERLNGVLHSLTRTTHAKERNDGKST